VGTWPPERRARCLALAAALALSACARQPPPALPEGVDLVAPTFSAAALERADARRMEKAWAAVRAGDGPAADREYRAVLKRRPDFVPAQAGLGYALLREGRYSEAGTAFDAVLQRDPAYVPALLGAATAARKRGDALGALELYRRAQSVSPQDPVVRRRLPEVRLQATEGWVHDGRLALEAGDTETAIGQFRKALEQAPEIADLRVETADLLAARGELSEAVTLLEQDPLRSRQVQLRLGRLLTAQGEHQRALEVYRALLERDPRDTEARREAEAARRASELARMPPEYQRIDASARLTRADLAALLAVRVSALGRLKPGEPEVATDIARSWARPYILRVLALALMDVYPNHTFQPGATVRRGDLADALGRILDRLSWSVGTEPVLRDMSPSHLFYRGATRVVAAGLMDVTAQGAFEPWRPVSGKDAVAVVEALARLLGP
jgi:tetratricopeptide (TPR) repeat protein